MLKKLALPFLAALSAVALVPTQASAAVLASDGSCSTSDVSWGAGNAALYCVGYYNQNILNSSTDGLDTQNAAIDALLAQLLADTGVSLTVADVTSANFGVSPQVKVDPVTNPLSFGTTLSGYTIIGNHWGGDIKGTGVYLLNITAPGISSVTISPAKGLSDAVLYGTGLTSRSALPEPATWAMMLVGMGLVGGAMRSRKRQAVTVRYA